MFTAEGIFFLALIKGNAYRVFFFLIMKICLWCIYYSLGRSSLSHFLDWDYREQSFTFEKWKMLMFLHWTAMWSIHFLWGIIELSSDYGKTVFMWGNRRQDRNRIAVLCFKKDCTRISHPMTKRTTYFVWGQLFRPVRSLFRYRNQMAFISQKP